MSPQPTVLAVPWPPLQLGEAGWRRRLEDLAARAESLVGRAGLGCEGWHCRGTWRDLKRCIQAVNGRLLGD